MHDQFEYLSAKLARKAKTDPFSSGPALLSVNSYGFYNTVLFPGMTPVHYFSFEAVGFLVRQDYWPVSWDRRQLRVAASLDFRYFVRGGSLSSCCKPSGTCAASFLVFWLKSNCGKVRNYLSAKTKFVQLLTNGKARYQQYMTPRLLLEAIYILMVTADHMITFLSTNEERPPPQGVTSDVNEGMWPVDWLEKVAAIKDYLEETATILLRGLREDEYRRTLDLQDAMTQTLISDGRDPGVISAWRKARNAVADISNHTSSMARTARELEETQDMNDSDCRTSDRDTNSVSDSMNWCDEEWDTLFTSAQTWGGLPNLYECDFCGGCIDEDIDSAYWYQIYDHVTGVELYDSEWSDFEEANHTEDEEEAPGVMGGILSTARDALSFIV